MEVQEKGVWCEGESKGKEAAVQKLPLLYWVHYVINRQPAVPLPIRDIGVLAHPHPASAICCNLCPTQERSKGWPAPGPGGSRASTDAAQAIFTLATDQRPHTQSALGGSQPRQLACATRNPSDSSWKPRKRIIGLVCLHQVPVERPGRFPSLPDTRDHSP